MPFCAYCGSLLEEGQTCKCRNQNASSDSSNLGKTTSSTPLETEINKLRNSAKEDVKAAIKEQKTSPQKESYVELESPFGVPSFSELIILAFILISLVMLIIPWWTQKNIAEDAIHRNIFYDKVFSVSVWLGFAKILGVLNIISFVTVLISSFFDINMLVPAVKDHDVKRTCGYVFFVIYALALITTFIAFLAKSSVGISVGWFFALAIAIITFVCWWKPDLIEQTSSTVKGK